MATAVLKADNVQTLEPKRMQCMEVWGGNRSIDSGVVMPGLDAWLFSQPCEQDAGGGDVHYVSTCAGGMLVRMLIADVAGHGTKVESIGSQLRGLMRRYINNASQSGFLRALNREFTSTTSDGRFATAIVMTFEAAKNRLVISNAGHPAPLWYQSKTGRWKYLEADTEGVNVPWGIEDEVDYQQFEVKLRVGDLVLGYTDSLTEARLPDGELLGQEGLLALVQSLGTPDPARLVSQILERIDNHGKQNLTRDDITCLLFRPNGMRPRMPLRDMLMAPIRVIADWGGVHFNWR
ncbi:MAG TPA: PP2C family protein-serine/threonine phosphatase [Humisphaera sp.]|jgi:serine phosphatase RsbU (regulator of sigma subunit)|nr:PP2C family protein-serine/threonine phosphatase [Humisphaera sp.]